MDTLLKDLRLAARALRKASGLTTATIVVLALGIGANTAIFSVVNAVLLRPLPYAEPDRIVTLAECQIGDRQPDAVAPANYLDWKAESRSFDAMAAYRGASFNMTTAGRPERFSGAVVTPEFFRVFGVGAALGRTLSPDTDAGARVAVLGDGLWKRRFGGTPDVLGRVVVLNGESVTVVGVMPPEFAYPSNAQVWVAARYAAPENALAPDKDISTSRSQQYFDVVGRLAPGVTTDAARADLDVVAARLAAEYPDSNDRRGVLMTSLRDSLVGDVRSVLVMLLSAVGFVLLIACANVANLLVARAATRRKEMATRAALGATRWRLVRQFLAESLLLSVAGGLAGLGLAVWTMQPLAAVAPTGLLGAVEPQVDWRVLGFSLVASLVTGLLFGLLPALQASRVDVNDVLKEASRGTTGGIRQNRGRSALVVFEIALSLVLLVGAGLMLKSLVQLQSVEPGFQPEGLVTTQIWLPTTQYADTDRRAAFFSRTLDGVRAIPGVQSAAAASRIPLNGGNSGRSFAIEGRPAQRAGEEPSANYRAVSSDFFATMRIPVLAGREITERDTKDAPRVVVVNDAFARKFFPGEEALGKRIDIREKGEFEEIVGVVGNVHHDDLATVPPAEMYVPFPQDPWPFMTIALRTSQEPAALAGSIEQAVRAVDPDQPVASVVSMEQLVTRSIASQRFGTSLLGLFATVALLLAAIGIYAVVSYSVAQRVHEIAIRMALGAGRRDVFRLVVGHGLALTAGGLALGLLAAFALTRVIAGMLFEVSPTDPAIFGGVALLLGGTAMLASLVPARRATRVDPMVALRAD